MSTINIHAIARTVQDNCHISDARYAGNYSLCIYLLKMREYYRWETNRKYTERLDNEKVGAWLSSREALWDEIIESEYHAIHVNLDQFDPWQSDSINNAIIPQGYVYSGGMGYNCRPHFFLGELVRQETYQDCEILVSGRELARDLTAPPAYTLGNKVFIRQESLKRVIWERIEEWNWRKTNRALSRAMEHYQLDQENIEASLDHITQQETNTVILHELGEIRANAFLGDEWNEMLAGLPRSQAELMARAVRDHLADCLSTLPALIEENKIDSIHFYFGNFHSIREKLFPGLAEAYRSSVDRNRMDTLRDIAARGAEHWHSVATEILTLYRHHGAGSSRLIEAHIEASVL